MEYIYVPLLAAKEKDITYKKGDRLVVKIDDAAFLGTITRIANGQIYLLFDDGDKGTVSLKSKRILGIGISRKVKKALELKHVQNYLKSSNVVNSNNKKDIKKKSIDPKLLEDLEKDSSKRRTNDNPYNKPKAQLNRSKVNFKPKKVSFSSLEENDWYQLKVENEDGDTQVVDGVIVYKGKNKTFAIYIDRRGDIVLSQVKPSSTATTLEPSIAYRISKKLSNNLINAYNKYCRIKYGKEPGNEYQAWQVATSLARLNLSRSI